MSSPLLTPIPTPGVARFIDIEDALVAWIVQCNIVAPESCRGGEEPANAAYPYVMVTRVSGTSDGVTDCPMVDVDIFHPDYTIASTIAGRIDRAIRSLKPRGLSQKPTVLVPVEFDDGTVSTVPFTVDRIPFAETPVYRDYQDTELKRLVGRYEIEHRCTAAA